MAADTLLRVSLQPQPRADTSSEDLPTRTPRRPLASGSFIQDRLELRVLQRFVLARHADEIQSQLGEEAITKASKAGSVAQFMETVSMQMCGDEPDDEMRYSDYLTAHSTTHLANSIERPVLFIASNSDCSATIFLCLARTIAV